MYAPQNSPWYKKLFCDKIIIIILLLYVNSYLRTKCIKKEASQIVHFVTIYGKMHNIYCFTLLIRFISAQHGRCGLYPCPPRCKQMKMNMCRLHYKIQNNHHSSLMTTNQPSSQNFRLSDIFRDKQCL